jgi:hypothetical protein
VEAKAVETDGFGLEAKAGDLVGGGGSVSGEPVNSAMGKLQSLWIVRDCFSKRKETAHVMTFQIGR